MLFSKITYNITSKQGDNYVITCDSVFSFLHSHYHLLTFQILLITAKTFSDDSQNVFQMDRKMDRQKAKAIFKLCSFFHCSVFMLLPFDSLKYF